MRATTQDAMQLFMEGQQALAEVEHHGMRVSTEYLDRKILETGERIKELESTLKADPVWSEWKKQFGGRANLGSDEQLRKIVYDVMAYPCSIRTNTRTAEYPDGKPSTSEEALKGIDLPFVRNWLDWQRIKDKIHTTYLKGLRREVVGGFIRPSYNLHTVWTYRSCVAKGTMIEIVRDVKRHPKGMPIEQVKAGDYAYCYDDDLNLTVRKVLWAGKTGTRKVVRIHWKARGKRGFLDVTPEHKIRVASGKYVEAQDLLKNTQRAANANKYHPRCRVLALGRVVDDDRLYITGQPCQMDHRFVYQQLIGPVGGDEVVHHRDGNHFNNVPGNLEKLSKSEHSSLHVKGTLLRPESKKRAYESRMVRIKSGAISFPKGEDNWGWKSISRFGLLRMLAISRGQISRGRVPYDYSTIVSRLKLFGYDLRRIKNRYDRDGRYISLGRLKRAYPLGRTFVMREFGLGFARTKDLLKERGLPLDRKWGNQFGAFVPHSHAVTEIEWLDQEVDVFDLEIEGCHNFIAGEVCVHNSGSDPNPQNIPARDGEYAELVRSAFIPRDGHCIVENDFKAAEVCSSAVYHKDPRWMAYITDPSKDMHRDCAHRLFLVDDTVDPSWWKQKDGGKNCRQSAKGNFVFASMYGSYYVGITQKLWEEMDDKKLSVNGIPMKKWLRFKGILERGDCAKDRDGKVIPPRPKTYEAHVKEFEDWYWNVQYPVYTQWKRDWFQGYLERGYIDLLTGFRCQGIFTRNQMLDAPIQGTAFHWLLWVLIELVKWHRKYKMKSRVIGQIHDSLISDVHEKEKDDHLAKVKELVTKGLQKRWPWICVPVTIEAEVTPVDGNWFQKKEIDISAY